MDTCPVVQKPTQQHQTSWAELSDIGQGQAGLVSDLRLYHNWFVLDFILLSKCCCHILFSIHDRNLAPSDKFERAGVSTTKWHLVWEQEDDRCMVQSCVHTSSYLFSSHQLISWCLRAFDEALLSPLFESLILNLANKEYPGWISFLFLSTKKLICNKRTMRYITDEILLKYTRS